MNNPLGIEAFKTIHQGIPAIVAFVPGTRYGFIWHGGCYIDQIILSENGDQRVDNHSFVYGCECINVWDYSTDQRSIPFEVDNVIEEITEWIDA